MRIRPGAGRAGRGTDAERAGRDALHLLAEGACAVCRQRDDGARSWLRYFVNDSNADPGVRARVRDAAGFCPAHTRHLLGDTSASWLLPSVQAEALAGGLRLLDDDRARRGPCPACEAGRAAEDRALVTVARALPQGPVRDAVCGGAVCLPHERALVARADADAGAAVTAAAADRLAGIAGIAGTAEGPAEGGDATVVALAGLDPDASARVRQLARLDPLLAAERAGAHAPVADRFAADLRLACCPLCLAEHRAARRLLRWAVTSDGDRRAEGTSTLCPRHLHDLAGLDTHDTHDAHDDQDDQRGPDAGALVAANAEAWRERLVGGTRPRGEPRCRACDEEQLAHARHTALLTALLHDPVHARAYQEAHGVCLRHVLRWDGPPPAPVDTVLRARLALLGWELAEARRKQDWRTRHEVKGAEMTSGSRASTLLDGRVHAGSPAPTGRG